MTIANTLEQRPLAETHDFLDPPPWRDAAQLDRLLERVAVLHASSLYAIQASVLVHFADMPEALVWLDEAQSLLGSDDHRAVLDHPIARIWMSLVVREMNAQYHDRAEEAGLLADLLADFEPMVGRIRDLLSRNRRPTFHRDDLDPLLQAAMPPSYAPPADAAAIEQARGKGHPLGFFEDVAQIAMQRIETTWPEVRRLVDGLVAMIVYLPDGDFRSCSASRYAGAMLISARDPSILDLEESIVHETGHQLLYLLVEDAPITDDGAAGAYKLPWSTQVRDIYGYFHAYFIYVILALYHERVIERGGDDGARAEARLRHILGGLVVAGPEIGLDANVTPAGARILANLAVEVAGLAERQGALLR